jgi:hypothetical protein
VTVKVIRVAVGVDGDLSVEAPTEKAAGRPAPAGPPRTVQSDLRTLFHMDASVFPVSPETLAPDDQQS